MPLLLVQAKLSLLMLLTWLMYDEEGESVVALAFEQHGRQKSECARVRRGGTRKIHRRDNVVRNER